MYQSRKERYHWIPILIEPELFGISEALSLGRNLHPFDGPVLGFDGVCAADLSQLVLGTGYMYLCGDMEEWKDVSNTDHYLLM